MKIAIAIMALLAGWHIDYQDAELIERRLAALNIPTQEPVIIDADKLRQGGCR
jgi:hypothetical protein